MCCMSYVAFFYNWSTRQNGSMFVLAFGIKSNQSISFHSIETCSISYQTIAILNCRIFQGNVPKDELPPVDPELQEVFSEWLLARERQLGHVSSCSFDLNSDPPGLPKSRQNAADSKASSSSKQEAVVDHES